MHTFTAGNLLNTWEQGRNRHLLDRALLLYALAAPELDPDTLADQPLGRRNAALLKLRQDTFGSRLNAYLDCPQCGERLEFEQSAASLLDGHTATDSSVEIKGLYFRPPTSRDLAHIVGETDMESAAHRLLQCCLLPTDGEPPKEEALYGLIGPVEAALDQADPLADVGFNFICPQCGHAWQTSFDIAQYLWEEIDAQSMRLLDEVHLLARAYGWRESEILALTPARRTAYLERVTL